MGAVGEAAGVGGPREGAETGRVSPGLLSAWWTPLSSWDRVEVAPVKPGVGGKRTTQEVLAPSPIDEGRGERVTARETNSSLVVDEVEGGPVSAPPGIDEVEGGLVMAPPGIDGAGALTSRSGRDTCSLEEPSVSYFTGSPG